MLNKTKCLSIGLAMALSALPTLGLAAEEVNLYNWPGYIPEDLLERFEAETGIKVKLDVYESNEAMLAKLQAGAAGYDVVVPSGYIIDTMVKEGLLVEINTNEMSNAGNIAEPFKAPTFDPTRTYTAPYMWGTTGIAYDTAKYGGELDASWKAFFEPEAMSGKVAALDDEVEVFNAAAYYLGFDKCTEDPAEGQKILDLLLAQKQNLLLYSSGGTIDRMVAGEVAMHHVWNGAAHRMRDSVPTIQYIYPKEGISLWVDNLAVPKGAPNLENAKTFINWLMAPANVAEITNFTGYMNAIAGSEDYIDEGLRNDPAVNMPAEFAERLRPGKACSAAARELRNKIWTKLKK